jgi:TPR repeat protein
MSDESQLQVRPKDAESSLILSSARSSLVARGRRDAAMLTTTVGAESEEQRWGLFPGWDTLTCDIDDIPTFEELHKGAEEGDARCQNRLAFSYLFGAGKDSAESARWYRKAADQGYAPAQFSLGFRLESSYLPMPGMGQDYVAAAKWYRRAADQGFAPAQFNLGAMYDTGEGVAQDYAEAVKWYRKAADQGLEKAQFNLGLKYDKGQGVARDSAEAAMWYRKAADKGYAPAQFNLGLKYENGYGVTRERVQAHMWMNLAIPHANVDDGKRYAAERDKIAAKMSPSQIDEAQMLAARWYRKAADQGSFVAQLNLGILFEKGEGVSQDYVQAHMWMNLAVSHCRLPECAAARDRLAAKMSPAQIAEAQRLAGEWKPTRPGAEGILNER